MAEKLLLDANLAILLAVGQCNRNTIAAHKRLRAFDTTDYDVLLRLISRASGLVFTPNVLTETSNLARYMAQPARSEVAATLASLTAAAEETYVQSRKAVGRTEYLRLGLTDAVLLQLGSDGLTLLTVDFELYLAAIGSGYKAVNFNHVREAARPDFA